MKVRIVRARNLKIYTSAYMGFVRYYRTFESSEISFNEVKKERGSVL